MSERTITIAMRARMSAFNQALRQGSQGVKGLGGDIQGMSARSQRNFRVAGAAAVGFGAAVALGLKSASDAARDFETTTTRMETLVGLARDEVDELSSAALRMGATGKGPQELGEALFFVTSAGLRGAEALEVTEQAAKAASLGLGDTSSVADAVTSAMNAYGQENLSAAEATDVLAAAVRFGKLEAESLAPVMGRLLPTASAMGVEFSEVAGTLAVMSRTGLDAAEASTSIQAIMSTMLKPTNEAEGALEAVGLTMGELRDMAAQPGGLLEVLRTLESSFQGNDEALAQVVPNVRALRGVMNVLAQDASVVDEVMDGVAGSIGLVDEAHEIWSGTAEASSERFSAALQAAQIGAGESTLGIRVALTDMATDVLNAYNELDAGTQTTITTVSGLASAVSIAGGAALLAIPKINQHRLAVQQLGSQAVTTRTMLAGLGRFMVGPWGIALAVGAGALALWAAEKRRAKEATDAYIASIEADTGAIGENTREHVASRLEKEGALRIAGRLGIALSDVADAALGEEDAMRRVRAAITDNVDPMAKLARDKGTAQRDAEKLAAILDREAGALDEAESATRRMAEASGDMTHKIHGTGPALTRLGESAEGAAQSQKDLSQSFDEVGTKVSAADSLFQAATVAVDDFTEGQKRLHQGVASFADPMGVYNDLLAEKEAKEREAAEKLAKATKDSSKSWEDFVSDVDVSLTELAEALDEQNAAHEEWEQNLLTVASRGRADLAAELAEMGQDGAELTAKFADATDAEFNRAADSWIANTRKGTGDSTDELGRGLALMNTLAQQGGEATVESLAKALGVGTDEVLKIARTYSSSLGAGILPILDAIGDAQSRMAVRRFISGQQVRSLNTGGQIPGGYGTFDDVPAMLTRGEFVQSVPAVQFYGVDVMKALNERKIDPHALHLNTGGSVDPRVSIREVDVPGFNAGGFTSTKDVPKVPSFAPASVPISTGAQAASGHVRNATVKWLEENLAPPLSEGIGWQAMWAAVSRRFPGVNLHSAYRPGAITATGNPSYHGMGRAIDITPSMDIFDWIATNYRNSREIIFSPANRRQIRNGSPHMYSGITRAQHWDHIHWAMANGGRIDEPIIGMGLNSGQSYSFGEDGPEYVIPERFHRTSPGALGQPTTSGQPFADLDRALAQPRSDEDRHGNLVAAREAIAALEAQIAANRELIRVRGLSDEQHIEHLTDLMDREVRFSAEWLALHDERNRVTQEMERERLERARIAFEFGAVGVDDYLAHLDLLITAEERFSQDWAGLMRERERIIEDITRAEEQAHRERQTAVDDAHDLLVRLLEEESRIRERMADVQDRYHSDVAKAQERFDEQMMATVERRNAGITAADERLATQTERTLRERQDRLAGFFAPNQRMRQAWGATLDALSGNLAEQLVMFRDFGVELQRARDAGVSEETIAFLGLEDASPESLAQLRQFTSSSQAEIDRYNRQVAEVSIATGRQVAREQRGMLGSVGDSLRESQRDHVDALADIQQTYTEQSADLWRERNETLAGLDDDLRTQMDALTKDLHAIGTDHGMAYAEALEAGAASGVAAVADAVRDLQGALRDLDLGGVSVGQSIADALAGIAVNLDGRVAGEVVSRWQGQANRAERIRAGRGG